MLSITSRATQALVGGLRGIVTSAASKSSGGNSPTYTYASPGTSMTEPAYLNEAASSSSDGGEGGHQSVAAMEEPVGRVKPSKKATMLKVLSTPRRKLTVQGAGVQMLPPGCSISDPSYSIKDPVYFTDVEK